jgi:hypothetical protein
MTGILRPSVTKEYINNQVKYLHSKYPNIEASNIKEFVKSVAQSKIVRPKAQIIQHMDSTSTVLEVDLLDHIRKHNDKTITPSGSWYETSDVKQAPDVGFMLSRLDLRKVHKNKMLASREVGQYDLALLEDFRQGMVKIGSNSVIGVSGSEYSILYDLENFNGITSIARHGIMGAYVFTERFLAHNMQFFSDEEVINYIVTTVRACPDRSSIQDIVQRFGIYEPTSREITDSLIESMQNYYCIKDNGDKIESLLKGLKKHERTFVAYHLNMRYLVHMNQEFFHKFITELMDVDNLPIDETIEVSSITKAYDEDLVQLLAVICGKIINGKVLSKLHNANDKDGNYDPDAVRRILSIGNYMKNKLNEIKDLFELFMYAKCTIPSIDNQKDLTRRTVILSDTDSVIFTVNDWVKWYCGHNEMSDRATRIASLIMYWLSKAISAYVFHTSYYRGAIGKFTSMIKLKNEYMFPILVRCDISKHYFALKTIQEGKFLSPPQLEMKGLQFKSSTLPSVTNDFTEKLIVDILNKLSTSGEIDINEYLSRILIYEQVIYESLKSGQLTFLASASLKHKEEYKTPEKSIYKNYLIWEKLFADKYGSIKLPTKVPLVSFIPKIFVTEQYLDWLSKQNNQAFQQLMDYPPDERAKITRLPIAGTLATIPEELIPCIDIRSVIYKNITPSHLVLRSFKIDLNNQGKRKLLYSDIYASHIRIP